SPGRGSGAWLPPRSPSATRWSASSSSPPTRSAPSRSSTRTCSVTWPTSSPWRCGRPSFARSSSATPGSWRARSKRCERPTSSGGIHDGPLQRMTAMAMRLDMLRRSLTDRDQLAAVNGVIEITHTTIDRLRHLLFVLHPSVLEEGGLAAAVRVLLDDLERETGTAGTLRNDLRAEPADHVR